MKIRKTLLSLLSLLCVLTLTGCSSTVRSNDTAGLSLPEPAVAHTAPIGDAGLQYTRTITLYVPGDDGRTLTRTYTDITTSYDRSIAQDAVQALLSYRNHCISPTVQLALYGQHPVMASGGICTVNLSSAALALDMEELYTAALCLSSTLCALPGINAVNVLAADQAIGMDITGNLPLGTLSAHAGEDASSLWNSFYSRRAPLGSDPSQVPVTSTAALYFPLADATGVISETRSITFAGQSPQQLCAGLLEALSQGAAYTSGCVEMPVLSSLLITPPGVSDMLEGGRLVTLRFTPDLEEFLNADGISLDCFLSSVILTITSFVPSVTAMSIFIGDEPITRLNSVTGRAPAVFTGGVVRRTGAEEYPISRSSIYMSQDGHLVSVSRAITAGHAESPRVLLNRMFQGPTSAERNNGISAVLPYALGDTDIIGLAVEGDTLILNLSSFFANSICTSAQSEQLLCYSMVNTLCEAMGLRRVVFFFAGQQLETLQGTLSWSGEFLYAPGLNGADRG